MKSNDDIRKHLSEKFEDFEVQPQGESWEAICFALDLKDKLETYEAEPQEESWGEIKFATDLVKKFDDYEAQPQTESWDKIRLSTNLSTKFKDYEAEPTDQSWKVIKAAITPEKDRRIVFWPFVYRASIAAGIALLLDFGWLIYGNNKENSLAETNKKSNQSVDNQVFNENKNQNLGKNKPSATKNIELDNQEKNTKITTPKPSVIEPSNDLSGVASNGKILNKQGSSIGKLNKLSTERQAAQVIRKREKGLFGNDLKNVISEEKFAQNNDKIPPIINTKNAESTAASNTNFVNQLISIELNLLNNKVFKQRNIRLPFGEIAFNNEIPLIEPEVRIRRKMILTGSIMPLQTYQALTLLPQTTTYIQQVGSLNAIDAQRLGLQARVGVMQPLSSRFSMGVSLAYAGIRQAVSYEVNNGTYDVDLTDSQLTLVGVSEMVSQNKFLHTVGLKLDNSYLVSSKKTKIFVLGGAEAVRVLNANQYAYYLNASVALAYSMKGGKTVWIEPTYRYSLSQSADVNNYLQIRPSNIGLNFRVNFM